MKKGIIAIIGIAILLVVSLMGSYNNLVKIDEKVTATWAEVETQYQRRADLIPNLINTVKGQANFERDTLTQVIEARSKATSTTIDPTNMTQEQLNQFQQSQNEVGSALSRLLVVEDQTKSDIPRLK